MIGQSRVSVGLGTCLVMMGLSRVDADWPQWRGPHRDAKAAGFNAPAEWPKELKQRWKVTVGDGVATPALVGDKLYVFAREGGSEVIRCLSASDGKEVWSDKYETQGADGPARGFAGPRASPTVAEGKVVTLGVRGVLSCYDAASGRQLWRKTDFPGRLPTFYTSCSPVVVDGTCIVQLGGEREGGIVAYDLATGAEKWKWTGDGTAYSSPLVHELNGAKTLIAETAMNVVGLSVADGKLLWKTPFPAQQRAYNACTPIADGQNVYVGGVGRGTKAMRIEKDGDALAAKELWTNRDNAVQYNSPLLKNGLIFGLSDRDVLFCIHAVDGKTAWTAPVPKGMASGGGGGGGAGGRMRGQAGYGSIVDAGSALVVLTPSGQLVVYEPSDKEFKQLASYKVAAGDTYGYPVLANGRLFVKDRDSVTLWTLD